MAGAGAQQAHNGSRAQRGPRRTRHTSNGTQPTAPVSCCIDTGSSEQPQPQPQPGITGEVQALLQQAVQQLVAQGCLPQQGLPPVKVVVPAASKLSKLPAGTLAASSCAHALAAAARKQQQQQQQQQPGACGTGQPVGAAAWASVDGLAGLLADAFNSRAAAAQMSQSVAARAAKGHLNFTGSSQKQTSSKTHSSSKTCSKPHSATERWSRRRLSSRNSNSRSSRQAQQQAGAARARRLQVVMVPNQFIQEEFELYCRYQIQQHYDAPADLTPSRYKNFLVDTPLMPVPAPAAAAAAGGAAAAGVRGGAPPCGYGSFHQQYWLDGKLVAVGVVDVLPRCLSSKYFFWDPDHAWLSLGRYGALREIEWVQQAHAGGASDLRYYYLGYYIHTCPKMAYKAEYAPSELLCPQRQVWVGLMQQCELRWMQSHTWCCRTSLV
ncbi:arginine-tRNA-protein transferase [Scenedesmus sp. NREL 46B-D3]|nr:arginine-tRNA-protein transferase [Scenedesmus sp. NREL 46B-D3]